MCLPKGQDSELSGFFVYCTQILGWLPPLIFSGLVQIGASQSIGVVAVAGFGVTAVIIISMLPSWPEVLADVAKYDHIIIGDENVEAIPEVTKEAENVEAIPEKAVEQEEARSDDRKSSLANTTPETTV
jgi:hypothetical protein